MRTSFPQLELDAQICFPLYAATRAVTQTYGRLLSDVGLTYPQYLTMLALWGAEEPLTVGEVGARLRLDSGTLTPLLKRLEAAGFVVRRRDPGDERRVLLEVSDQGWELRERVAHVPGALVESLSMSAKEGAELRRLLHELLEHLDADG
ncbi:MarR family winged helix-turn-helix transcriptional regulator [Nocardioides pocheonensis]|uniref:MarR family transcriptional regulator n=1 Tax=Nocardioides pocheonensis TaxID=661485 RepID=A0A3N0GYF8_9ACTN|nr:MarR family transcriptional regulator [Nocardioides pocheonensis]RNM17449.1 MarR family transcriptional regulator [Nocardioides pocheonensis]